MTDIIITNVYLFPTWACNLSCSYCAVNAGSQNVEKLNADDFNSIIKQLVEYGLKGVKISGGEPFIESDTTLKILEYCYNMGLYTDIETNATLIKDEHIPILDKTGVRIGISLDSIDECYHNYVRGNKEAYSLTLKTIKKLAMNNMQDRMVILTSLCPENEEKYDELVNYLHDSYGIFYYKVNPIIPIGRAATLSEGKLYSVIDRIRISNMCNELSKKYKVCVSIGLPPALCESKEQLATITTGCAFKNLLSVYPNGDITTCTCGNISFPKKYGNIKQQTLNEILSGDLYRKVLSDLDNDITGICGQCIYYKYCKGGCRMEAALYGSDGLRSPLPLCQQAYEHGLFPESKIITKL